MYHSICMYKKYAPDVHTVFVQTRLLHVRHYTVALVVDSAAPKFGVHVDKNNNLLVYNNKIITRTDYVYSTIIILKPYQVNMSLTVYTCCEISKIVHLLFIKN